MLWSTDTCQNKVSADQYHISMLWAQVKNSSRSHGFSKLTADQVLVFIGLQAHVKLMCCNQGYVVQKPVNANPGLKVN